MNHYDKIDWEYTQEEMLELDNIRLSDAQVKINRGWMNLISAEFYRKEVEELTESIKFRTEMLLVI